MTVSASQNGEVIDLGAREVGALYAKAFLGATEAAGQTEALLAELDSLLDDVLVRLPDLESILASAMVPHEARSRLLDRALAATASPMLLNFLKVLSSRGRLGYLQAIRRAVREQYDVIRGRVRVEVSTATPLEPTLVHHLREQLRRMLAGEPWLAPVVRPELIGGVVLRIGDTVYDGSVSSALERARTQMIERSVHEIQSRRDRFRHPEGN